MIVAIIKKLFMSFVFVRIYEYKSEIIMKKSRMLLFAFIVLMIGACSLGKKDTGIETLRTVETDLLFGKLKQVSQTGFMFGHQDATVYGIGWDGDSARSDVKSVCGDYPAVCGWEIGRIEKGKKVSLDNVDFDRIRKEMILNYQRGGINTLSWHADNPVTGGDSWDISAKATVVGSILSDSVKHSEFLGWLDIIAAYCSSLVTEEGVKIPVLFRPWHEHTGSWFWWGKDFCTPEQYKALWILTYDYLHSKGVDNLLYAYSPCGGCTKEEYMERYPGDEYVDLLGFDYYQNRIEDTESYQKVMNETLGMLAELGKEHSKPIAVTETGLMALPIDDWWTNVLYPILENYPISYVLVWRNARELENHYFAPYPGHSSAADFVDFYKKAKTLFLSDINGPIGERMNK